MKIHTAKRPPGLSGPLSYLWDLDQVGGDDRRFQAERLTQLESRVAWPIARHYRHLYMTEHNRAANLFLLAASQELLKHRAPIGASDEKIRRSANQAALLCSRRDKDTASPDFRLAALSQVALAYQIDPPKVTQTISTAGAINRLCDATWWFNQLRTLSDQLAEQTAIQCGDVHRLKGLYVSDETVNRYKTRKARNQRSLANIELTNELGDTFDLEELCNRSVANPTNRRNELMCRLAGFDHISQDVGHVGTFLTITCPSRFHARQSGSGKANPKYDGSTPRDGRDYLQKLWTQIRAKLARLHIHPYGFRITEPQHDGTPHWHLLLFAQPDQVELLETVCKDYALRENPNEKGADKHRFTAERIDPKKGSAIGYIAKYIAKNVDGAHLQDDENETDPASAAERTVIWASIWHIRQFQQIGGPPVTAWREARKTNQRPGGLVSEAADAADRGDWREFFRLYGGPSSRRNEQPIKIEKVYNDAPDRYGDPKGNEVLGIVDSTGHRIWTRLHTWTRSRKDRHHESAPQTSPRRGDFVAGCQVS